MNTSFQSILITLIYDIHRKVYELNLLDGKHNNFISKLIYIEIESFHLMHYKHKCSQRTLFISMPLFDGIMLKISFQFIKLMQTFDLIVIKVLIHPAYDDERINKRWSIRECVYNNRWWKKRRACNFFLHKMKKIKHQNP